MNKKRNEGTKGVNKVKRLIAVSLLSIMFLGVTIIANATTHKCAYSYMGNQTYEVRTMQHPYTIYKDGESKIETCNVEYRQIREVYKCACGNTYYVNLPTVVVHLGGCGN